MTMFQRFEFRRDGVNKFWQVTVTGGALTERFGRTGSNGRKRVTAYSSVQAATSAVAIKVQERLASGYVEVRIPSDAVNRRALFTPITTLLGGKDWETVQKGLALALELDDPQLWSKLTDKCGVQTSYTDKGMVYVFATNMILGRVKPQFRQDVALYALLATGKLADIGTLKLEASNLRDLRILTGCAQLANLSIKLCENLTSLEGLESCHQLAFLELEQCNRLEGLDGVMACKTLRTLKLKSCRSIVELCSTERIPNHQRAPEIAGAYERHLNRNWGASRIFGVYAPQED